jgi:hypothetical protein
LNWNAPPGGPLPYSVSLLCRDDAGTAVSHHVLLGEGPLHLLVACGGQRPAERSERWESGVLRGPLFLLTRHVWRRSSDDVPVGQGEVGVGVIAKGRLGGHSR